MKAQYIAKNINSLSLSDRYIVAKILYFKDYNLIQSNNGVYIHLKDIEEETINHIIISKKTKLIHDLIYLCFFDFLFKLYYIQ